MLSNESGPGRPTGLHPGLAEMKEEEGKVVVVNMEAIVAKEEES